MKMLTSEIGVSKLYSPLNPVFSGKFDEIQIRGIPYRHIPTYWELESLALQEPRFMKEASQMGAILGLSGQLSYSRLPPISQRLL